MYSLSIVNNKSQLEVYILNNNTIEILQYLKPFAHNDTENSLWQYIDLFFKTVELKELQKYSLCYPRPISAMVKKLKQYWTE